MPGGVSDELKKTLQIDAIQLSDETSTSLLKLWLVQSINSTATSDQVKNGLTYREWTEGAK